MPELEGGSRSSPSRRRGGAGAGDLERIIGLRSLSAPGEAVPNSVGGSREERVARAVQGLLSGAVSGTAALAETVHMAHQRDVMKDVDRNIQNLLSGRLSTQWNTDEGRRHYKEALAKKKVAELDYTQFTSEPGETPSQAYVRNLRALGVTNDPEVMWQMLKNDGARYSTYVAQAAINAQEEEYKTDVENSALNLARFAGEDTGLAIKSYTDLLVATNAGGKDSPFSRRQVDSDVFRQALLIAAVSDENPVARVEAIGDIMVGGVREAKNAFPVEYAKALSVAERSQSAAYEAQFTTFKEKLGIAQEANQDIRDYTERYISQGNFDEAQQARMLAHANEIHRGDQVEVIDQITNPHLAYAAIQANLDDGTFDAPLAAKMQREATDRFTAHIVQTFTALSLTGELNTPEAREAAGQQLISGVRLYLESTANGEPPAAGSINPKTIKPLIEQAFEKTGRQPLIEHGADIIGRISDNVDGEIKPEDIATIASHPNDIAQDIVLRHFGNRQYINWHYDDNGKVVVDGWNWGYFKDTERTMGAIVAHTGIMPDELKKELSESLAGQPAVQLPALRALAGYASHGGDPYGIINASNVSDQMKTRFNMYLDESKRMRLSDPGAVNEGDYVRRSAELWQDISGREIGPPVSESDVANTFGINMSYSHIASLVSNRLLNIDEVRDSLGMYSLAERTTTRIQNLWHNAGVAVLQAATLPLEAVGSGFEGMSVGDYKSMTMPRGEIRISAGGDMVRQIRDRIPHLARVASSLYPDASPDAIGKAAFEMAFVEALSGDFRPMYVPDPLHEERWSIIMTRGPIMFTKELREDWERNYVDIMTRRGEIAGAGDSVVIERMRNMMPEWRDDIVRIPIPNEFDEEGNQKYREVRGGYAYRFGDNLLRNPETGALIMYTVPEGKKTEATQSFEQVIESLEEQYKDQLADRKAWSKWDSLRMGVSFIAGYFGSWDWADNYAGSTGSRP